MSQAPSVLNILGLSYLNWAKEQAIRPSSSSCASFDDTQPHASNATEKPTLEDRSKPQTFAPIRIAHFETLTRCQETGKEADPSCPPGQVSLKKWKPNLSTAALPSSEIIGWKSNQEQDSRWSMLSSEGQKLITLSCRQVMEVTGHTINRQQRESI